MNITRGKRQEAQKIVLYGPEGIGKSTFAAQFPQPLFIDTEGSTAHMDVLPEPSGSLPQRSLTFLCNNTSALFHLISC